MGDYVMTQRGNFKVDVRDFRTGSRNSSYPVKNLKTKLKNISGTAPNFEDIFRKDLYLTKTGRKVKVLKKCSHNKTLKIECCSSGLRKYYPVGDLRPINGKAGIHIPGTPSKERKGVSMIPLIVAVGIMISAIVGVAVYFALRDEGDVHVP